MSYRPSANPPQTAWAHHLDRVMRDRGWSRVRLFEEVGADLGYSDKSRSAFLRLLEDKEPTEAQASVLRRRYGDPDPLPEPPSPEPSLAEALMALAAELAEARKERAELRRRLDEVDEVLRTLVGPAMREAAGHDPQLHSVGSEA